MGPPLGVGDRPTRGEGPLTTDQHTSASTAVREQAMSHSGWRSAHGERFDVLDPTDERGIASIPAGSAADVEEASSARRAQSEWARTPARIAALPHAAASECGDLCPSVQTGRLAGASERTECTYVVYLCIAHETAAVGDETKDGSGMALSETMTMPSQGQRHPGPGYGRRVGPGMIAARRASPKVWNRQPCSSTTTTPPPSTSEHRSVASTRAAWAASSDTRACSSSFTDTPRHQHPRMSGGCGDHRRFT